MNFMYIKNHNTKIPINFNVCSKYQFIHTLLSWKPVSTSKWLADASSEWCEWEKRGVNIITATWAGLQLGNDRNFTHWWKKFEENLNFCPTNKDLPLILLYVWSFPLLLSWFSFNSQKSSPGHTCQTHIVFVCFSWNNL